MEPAAELQRALALRQRGDLDGAHQALCELIAQAPSCAAAFNDRGVVRIDLGQLDGAIRDLAEAVRLDPDLAEARRNFRIVRALGVGAGDVRGAASTVSSTFAQAGQSGSFAGALVEFLRREVAVAPGHEDRREDAIHEVVVRVLGLSRSDDLPLAEALRRMRRESTRAWVQSLLGLSHKQELPRLEGDVAASTPASEPRALRLDACLAEIQEQVLDASTSATRWRRRIVWDVYVGALVEGVHLTRAEAVLAVRALKISRRRAKDSQILADLDLISATLRRAAP